MKHKYLKHLVKGIQALACASPAPGAGNVNGTAINLVAQPECFAGIVLINVGAPTGTPTSFSATYKLQTSTDNFSADTTDVANVVVTAAGMACIPFDPNGLSQYVRVRRELSFVSGTSPTLPDCAILVLGDPKYGPLAGV